MKQIQIKKCSVNGLWYSDLDTYKDRFYRVVEEPTNPVKLHGQNHVHFVYIVQRGVKEYVVIRDDAIVVSEEA